MPRTKQDWYNGKGPMLYWTEACEKRGHRLISLSGIEDGSGKIAKGKITFYCNNCDTTITTSVAAYQIGGTKTTKGCRICKAARQKQAEAEKKANKPTPTRQFRRRAWAKDSPFKNREDIIKHLMSEDNPHNRRVLELIKRDPKILSTTSGEESAEVEGWHTSLEIHHIIPYHDGGVDRVYNTLKVTRYEHWEIHLLRFETYGQFGDAYVFNFCWNQLPEEFKNRLRVNKLARTYLASVMD